MGRLRIAVLAALLILSAAGSASAQDLIIDMRTDTGIDSSYSGLPLTLIFNVDANGYGPLEAIVLASEIHFTNGNTIGPIVDQQQFFFEDFGLLFLSYTYSPLYGNGNDPDSILVGCVAKIFEGWTGADDLCRIEVTPSDTGTITFVPVPMPPGNANETGGVGEDSIGAILVLGYQWDNRSVVIDACPSALMGDVNNDQQISSADIIYLVNYVFRGGAPPLPVALAGDADCNRRINSADMIHLAAYIFRGGPVPCPCVVPGS